MLAEAFATELLIVIATIELANLVFIGPPWVIMKDKYLLNELKSSSLNTIDKNMLDTIDGYFSVGPPSIFGRKHFSRTRTNSGAPTRRTKIPFWSPLSKKLMTNFVNLIIHRRYRKKNGLFFSVIGLMIRGT